MIETVQVIYEQDSLLQRIMSDDNVDIPVLTICGSYRFRALKEKYQAFYTIKNNLVFMPVNYMSIKNEVETCKDSAEINAKRLANIHDKKIMLSEGIIVVNGGPDSYEGYIGKDTLREISFALAAGTKILFTFVPHEDRYKYYFNNDKTYPLYILKEEYL